MIVRRILTGAVLAAAMFAVSACKYSDLIPAEAPLPAALVKAIQANGMGVNSPILVRLFKEESDLEIWKQKTDGTYALLKTYEICAWSGKLGPKKAEGDRQAPEGFYNVNPSQLNPNSSYHLAINMGYPNTYDRANGRTGSHLMIHGSCSSMGCYAMDDEQVQEIYGLARHSFQGGQRNFQIQAYPFRMTPKNMARHRNSEHYEFWKMLKKGSDYFEVTRKPPHVGVCDRSYVFDQSAATVATLDPTGPCPSFALPEPVIAKHYGEDSKVEELVSTMSESDFAQSATFSYRTGEKISAGAYAAEQHRRAGYDKDGKRIRSGIASFMNR
ncbi:murein L,D-transpeptidase family protein [Fulvimarina sp. 2208YS6-2-32]|uniref:Murein L,D-transpeptidase family protein n=1 Tax=Fulvimarina uroteuthidis TaxID=3098149 RepID=A0ABU5HZ04_9HYPH|nr:murein L,D-transpeptidase family protein [Fulvimarina sp. 2208YS6-2-32]MDY8107829.1 murein L,D-transpeptidase family protein [Fulvimarina sp. 2208YS6-2-32]